MKIKLSLFMEKDLFVWSLVTLVFSLLLQSCWVEEIIITKQLYLIISFVIVSLLIFIVFCLLFICVIHIKYKLKAKINSYIDDMFEETDEGKANIAKKITELRDTLKVSGIHRFYLYNYLICLVSIIVGYGGIYKVIYLLNKNSFFMRQGIPLNACDRFVNFIYYSFVTITTLGYGDISPNNAFAKWAVIFEMIIGIVLLIIIINIFLSYRTDIEKMTDDIIGPARKRAEARRKEMLRKAKKYRAIGEEIKGLEEVA